MVTSCAEAVPNRATRRVERQTGRRAMRYLARKGSVGCDSPRVRPREPARRHPFPLSPASGTGRLDLHKDVAPLPLAEPQDAQRAARGVSQHDRQPDVRRSEAPDGLEYGADAEGHDDLRDDGDTEG